MVVLERGSSLFAQWRGARPSMQLEENDLGTPACGRTGNKFLMAAWSSWAVWGQDTEQSLCVNTPVFRIT